MGHETPDLMADRLVMKTKKAPSGCVEWQGRRHPGGYAGMEHGKEYLAHRIAYLFFVGPIPKGLCVLHECDNPICVSPGHLFLGTRDDNNKDRAKKGRNADTHGSKHPRAKLTEADILAIRAAYRPRSKDASYAALGRKYGVDHTAIYMIVKRKNWRHL